jgi:hypothetical protein
VYTIKINHKGIGVTEYPIYQESEAKKARITYEYWQKAEEGDWAQTDDGWVAKVISKKTYTDSTGRDSFYYRMPFGYIMWNPKYPNKKFCAGGRSANNTFTGKKWLDVVLNTEPYKALAMWAALTEDRDVAIDQVFGPVSTGKRRKLRRHMRTESFRSMKRDEAQRLLTDKRMDANFFIDLMNEGIEMAKEKKDVNSIRGFVNDGFEIHGMKDKETITTTDRLEAVQTRKLIDNINQEEEKLIATRKVEEPAGDR